MNTDYLLQDEYARHLYQNYAATLPIIDYHNHLSATEIRDDRVFDNITQLWITSDPYKHRAMRILGIPEKYITGDASDYEKFEAWYGCLPRLVGNVLFDWSIMEWEQVFHLSLFPLQENVRQVWDTVNEKLKSMSTKSILNCFPITYCAPCASLLDDVTVYDPARGLCPSLRGDDLVAPTVQTVQKLEQLTGLTIQTLTDLKSALDARMQAFVKAGCKFADHALDDGFSFVPDDGGNEARFAAILQGKSLSGTDHRQLFCYLFTYLAGTYARLGMTMQLHIGARRSTSSRLRDIAGPAGGYAAMGNTICLSSLTEMLDYLEKQPQGLPKILLFPLNPTDNAMISTLSGSFSKDGVEAIVSQGPAWWWCDHYQGIRNMLDHLTAYGVLSTFTGMTTDSRSLLSFVRHDYFRRILCSWISERVQKGIFPNDETILADLIRKICYENASKLCN